MLLLMIMLLLLMMIMLLLMMMKSKGMNTLFFQSFQNQTVGMTAILTSGEGIGGL